MKKLFAFVANKSDSGTEEAIFEVNFNFTEKGFAVQALMF